MKNKRKIAIIGIALALVAGLAISAGCAPKRATTAAPAQQGAAATQTTQAQTTSGAVETESMKYASMFPLQYDSLHATRTNAKGILIGHSVENLRDICEAPVTRDNNGAVEVSEDGTYTVLGYEYDSATGRYQMPELDEEQLKSLGLYTGCLSCKTSRFNNIYAEQGAAAYGHVYDAEARAIVGDDYFDCAMCHDGAPSASSLKANMVYFQQLGGDFAANLDPKLAVCGQCHNSYDYRSKIKTEDDIATFRPYRYGYDLESVFKAAYEDGVNFSKDEETGISDSYALHVHIEGYLETKMAEMGVTCVDCHMPKSTDNGKEYTNHFAANSPLESEDSLNYCLTCHSSMGIGSTDEMVSFVRGKEAEMAASMEALQAREAEFKAALETAIKSGSKDEATLDKARELYAKVSWYDKVMVTGAWETPGSMVAMLDTKTIFETANSACDEGMKLIA